MNKRIVFLSGFLLIMLACTLGNPPQSQTSDLLATLAASTPLTGSPAAPSGEASESPTLSSVILPTPIPSTLTVPTSASTGQPTGKIVYTCQIFKVQAGNQICIINADGTGFRRLTTDDSKQHYYPSLSPDGRSVIYAAFRESNVYEIYEMNIASGAVVQLTNRLGNLNAPEISPDGESIVFKRARPNSDENQLFLMERNGADPNNIPALSGWDPTWSPDGKLILFASNRDGAVQLFTVRANGKGLHKVSNLPAIRGRSDWSPDGKYIVTYSGAPWEHEVFLMTADGSNAHILSPLGGNSQGASFSPDSQWIAFTAYFDHPSDDHGCEIYIMRIDGTDLRRLTSNDYCDYQPRWGP
ncbi:MAG: PD40 domain-containing protein [Anaerolineales bacterium]|nr:PD40 domain-containing protein [Anaerolineales bacterium]